MRHDRPRAPVNDYPAGDGKPIAETDWHRNLLCRLIDTLDEHYADKPDVYVSGALLVFYQEGNRRSRIAPDVFVVKGVPKLLRDNFLVWQEGRVPAVVIELTSRQTRREDWTKKLPIYRDRLRVPEVFVFDVLREYLKPPLQGFRLHDSEYVPISATEGRLPSEQLQLHLEADGDQLRLWNPATGRVLTRLADQFAELERLRRELEDLKRKNGR